MIIHADKTEMTDDERMLRIDKIYDDMQDKHAFVIAFNSDTKQLSSQRSKEEREVEIFRKIQGEL
jgi:hypothetical protein